MPRLLFLAYHFPPVGGAGVQRSVKFVRYLPEHGWEPVVVTGPLGSIGDSYLTDETLGHELPAALDVHRLAGPEPLSGRGWRGRAERLLRLPTAWSRWWVRGAVETGRELGEIDLVLATMSPFESCAAAARLARSYGVPWVADLRDPWALDEMRVYTSRAHRRLERRRMRRSLASAAAIVMNTPEAAAQLVTAFPELGRRRVLAIPNGFDSSDFAETVAPAAAGAFRVVHTGDLHTAFGLRHRSAGLVRRLLGGTLGDVDILPRSHVFLLEAVDRLLERRPELRDGIEIHLAGGMDAADRAAIRTPGVVLHEYVSHGEAIRLMQSADLLFLPMHAVPPPRRARIVPGKTYEYLASRRPILAAIPDGDARDLLGRAGSALLCRPADVACLERSLESQVDRKRAGDPPARPDEDVLAGFERRRLTAELAAALDAVLGAKD